MLGLGHGFGAWAGALALLLLTCMVIYGIIEAIAWLVRRMK